MILQPTSEKSQIYCHILEIRHPNPRNFRKLCQETRCESFSIKGAKNISQVSKICSDSLLPTCSNAACPTGLRANAQAPLHWPQWTIPKWGLTASPPFKLLLLHFLLHNFWDFSGDADLYFKKKKELILGRLAAILYDDVIMYAVPAEPIESKRFKIYIYSYRCRQHSPTSFTHTHTQIFP